MHHVGMGASRQIAVGSLDLVVARVFSNAEGLVVIVVL
jgi:hypothetical protein